EADLDEMVARAEAAQLEPPVRRDPLGAVGAFAALKFGDPRGGPLAVDLAVVLACRERDRALDRLPGPRPIAARLDVAGGESCAHRDHPAADVDTDGCGNDRA